MKIFEIEHIGLSVKDPIEMAKCYEQDLGFVTPFSAQDGEKAVAFIEDGSGKTVLELGKIPDVPALAEDICHHLELHIALKSDDPARDAEFLEANGAKFIEECPIRLPGDDLIVMRDPWGNTLQLAKRGRGPAQQPQEGKS